jgi:hypothetical protein
LDDNETQTNTDGDSQGDACDTDDDNDGVLDGPDNCDLVANPAQGNWDGDAFGDACEDSDLDLYYDNVDNCPGFSNPGQADTDADGDGDGCDNCQTTANPTQGNWNGDALGDACQNSDTDIAMDDKEVWVGTNPADNCANNNGADNELVDATPYDTNDNQTITISDALKMGPAFNTVKGVHGNYNQRFDINMSSSVTLTDLLSVAQGGWNQSCA